MGFLSLLKVASMPVLKVLMISALGSLLASDHADILGENARKHLNNMVFFVFNPALVFSNLARTVTLDSILLLWFMPFNILLTFILGSILGWILFKLTRAPQHLKGLILGSSAAGNMGNLPVIIIPAICHEKGSPFGAADVCHTYGMVYASLSMAVGSIYLWTCVYNIVRVSSNNNKNKDISAQTSATSIDCKGERSYMDDAYHALLPCPQATDKEEKVPITCRIKKQLTMLSRKINLKAVLAPSTIAAIAGFIVGLVPILRMLLIGTTAPLHVVHDSASLLGDAAIPAVTLIIGANLLRGLKGTGIHLSVVIGIAAIHYIFLPLVGIVVVKGAIYFGLVHSDPLYQFVLLLQFALPPAMNIGTITQLFGAGESECSVILLWTYALASISLTLWSTFFMWLVA
nr:protein PIN-LIKES 3-like isoform X1 [Ipomoea batatas]